MNNRIIQASKHSLSCLKSNNGFTLLELIVVSTLIVLLLSLSAPNITSVLSSPLKKSTRNIVYFFQNAREVASSEQQFCKIEYNPDTKELISQLIPITQDQNSSDSPSVSSLKTYTLPESIRMQGFELQEVRFSATNEFEIWIGPKGQMQPLAIHLSNDNGENISIHFEPIIAKSHVFDAHTSLNQQ